MMPRKRSRKTTRVDNTAPEDKLVFIEEGGERVSGTSLKGVRIYDAEKEIKK